MKPLTMTPEELIIYREQYRHLPIVAALVAEVDACHAMMDQRVQHTASLATPREILYIPPKVSR